MPISTTWVNPSAAGALDLATGAILTETWTDGVASDLLRLGGTTGQVTANGATLGLTPNLTTTSTSFVTLDGAGASNELRVDLTTTGGDVIVWASLTASNSATSGGVQLGLALDGAVEVAVVQSVLTTGNDTAVLSTSWRFSGVSAAAHIFRARWKVNSGTGTAPGIQRSIVALELKR